MKLRPWQLSEILDGAVKLYRENWTTLLLLVAFIRLPLAIIPTMTMYWGYEAGLFTWEPQPGEMPDVNLDMLTIILIVSLVQMLLQWLGLTFSDGAVTWCAVERVLGRPIGFRRACRAAWSRFLRLLAASYLVTFAASMALVIGVFPAALALALTGSVVAGVLLALPGVALMVVVFVWFGLFTPVIMVEDSGPIEAMTRSKALVDGHWWRVALPLIGLGVMCLLGPALVIAVPGKFIAEGLLSRWFPVSVGAALVELVYQLALAALVACWSCGVSLVYLNQRMRKEGLDLLMRALESHEGPAARRAA